MHHNADLNILKDDLASNCIQSFNTEGITVEVSQAHQGLPCITYYLQKICFCLQYKAFILKALTGCSVISL